jgi:hypothetical protein
VSLGSFRGLVEPELVMELDIFFGMVSRLEVWNRTIFGRGCGISRIVREFRKRPKFQGFAES